MSLQDIFRKLASFLFPPGPVDRPRLVAGPDPEEHPLITPAQAAELQDHPMWSGALWRNAKYLPAHPGRVGLVIVPRCTIVHTTDMHPSSWGALVKAWTERAADGACAHFLIGRDASQGVVQFVPITRNANHAGGKVHGWYKTGAGSLLHPNTVAVGIELHAAGRLQATGKPGEWRHPDSGLLIPSSDVEIDARGFGWHKITDYQLGALKLLLDDLAKVLAPLPDGTTVSPDASYASQGVLSYATSQSAKLVGHVSLDPINRMDPGPFMMQWLWAYERKAS
jgi:N-acetyl-anhydromuramyl-L-alanine amidase AmpD